MNFIYTHIYNSPCGELLLGSYEDSLCMCDWTTQHRRSQTESMIKETFQAEYKQYVSPVIENAICQLDEYFAGKRSDFYMDYALGGSIFQQLVWTELLNVQYGETISYKELANRMGRPTSVRAVANAVGANPISIFIPCHRIIGADGSLTGYAGGLETKKHLLDIENSYNLKLL